MFWVGGQDNKNRGSKLHPAYLYRLLKNLASEDGQ